MNLREYRESKGLTRRVVASAIDTTEQTIINVESGKYPSEKTLDGLSNYYGVSRAEIISMTDK